MTPLRINLEPEEIPTRCYNVVADMASYDKYFAGQLEDFDYPAAAIAESLKHLPKVG